MKATRGSGTREVWQTRPEGDVETMVVEAHGRKNVAPLPGADEAPWRTPVVSWAMAIAGR